MKDLSSLLYIYERRDGNEKKEEKKKRNYKRIYLLKSQYIIVKIRWQKLVEWIRLQMGKRSDNI